MSEITIPNEAVAEYLLDLLLAGVVALAVIVAIGFAIVAWIDRKK